MAAVSPPVNGFVANQSLLAVPTGHDGAQGATGVYTRVMPFASAEGATIHYVVEGAGPDAVLLLMGLGGHHSEWGEPFVAELARDHRVIRMDNRGIEQSQSATSTWTMEDMAEDARAVLDALGLRRAHVVGTSMGGMIAQTLALAHPARVSKLVLSATMFGGAEVHPPEPRAQEALGPQPGVSVAEQRRNGLRALAGPAFLSNHGPLIDLLVAQRDRHPTSAATFRTQLEAIIVSDRSQRVATIRCPTLVIHGELDPLVPVANGRMLAERIPGARFVMLPDCGHMPHLEFPLESANAIRDFLSEP
jgi:3-oxoadipate enol-lactonase